MRNAKERIKKALAALSRESDFADISAKSIYETAGVSKQSFYNYYLDKYDVVFDLFRDDVKLNSGDDNVFINPSELLLNADKLTENKDLYLACFYGDADYKMMPYIVEYAYNRNVTALERILGDAVTDFDRYCLRVWVYGGMHIFTEWLAGRIDTPKEKLIEYSYQSVPEIIKRAEKAKRTASV